MHGDRVDEVARAEELNPRPLAPREVTTPELVEKEGVEAVVPRVDGEDVDRRRQHRENLIRRDAGEPEVILAAGRAVHMGNPAGVWLAGKLYGLIDHQLLNCLLVND